jgi:hypothetical protein
MARRHCPASYGNSNSSWLSVLHTVALLVSEQFAYHICNMSRCATHHNSEQYCLTSHKFGHCPLTTSARQANHKRELHCARFRA